ncbi:ABC transporter permease [Tahibacter amnicola]|uniref:ABC transporter permease n=1 Tax=Tahibacter amnicola TaxID=2976241 RepID=A0ABY6BGL6_9GAMM|nr:ABC transporter permease [Tahibacter amnicola]UXI69158.1 ABC transporter permease [Tahibacter amnicola]
MFKETTAITGINLKSVPERWAPSLVIMIGLAGVVAVLTALLAMGEGFRQTLAATGSRDVALILRGGSNTELNSGMSRNEASVVEQAPGIKKDAEGKPLLAKELTVITELLKKGETVNGSNVTLRGVDPNSFKLRPQLRLVEGRMFEPGLRELVVGRGVTRQFSGAAVGEVIRMRSSEWKVVGVFESGDASESELWADAETAQTSFGRQGYSSILAALDGEGALETLRTALSADRRLTLDVQTQQDYYSAQTKNFRMTIGVLAGFITVVMGLGAIFAALNTMYAVVATRSREIATLRALGFGAFPVVLSVMIEAIVLALVGGLSGALIAYVLFNNFTVSTLSQNFTQVVFSFKVTPALVVQGLIVALIIGTIGGLLPAIRAARLPVTTALRES